MEWLHTFIRVLLLVGLTGLTSACVNLANLRDILNTVSYEQRNIAYTLDTEQTRMMFSVGDTNGQFRVFSAQLGFDQADISSGQLNVTVATGSIDLANPLIEEMLRGAAWFHSDTHPLAGFEANSITQRSADVLTARGTLTIKGITQPLSLNVTFPDGLPDLTKQTEAIRFAASGTFSRASYNMTSLTEFAPDEVSLNVEGVFALSARQIDSAPQIATQ